MLSKRVIPCLDVSDGRVVKGINFENLRDAGNPVELAKFYDESGADELTFLDISASVEGRKTTLEMVSQTADQVFIPLTVGGGISDVEDVNALLRAGADKVSVNTAAIKNPQLLNEISERFGDQVLVLSVDARRADTKSGTKGNRLARVLSASDLNRVRIESGWAVLGNFASAVTVACGSATCSRELPAWQISCVWFDRWSANSPCTASRICCCIPDESSGRPRVLAHGFHMAWGPRTEICRDTSY